MRIPDQDTLKIKGTIFEHERRFFKPGDPVVVHTAAHPEQPLQGVIASLSVMPHDRGEKDEEAWLQESDSGIMVYDVVVDLPEKPEWLRVGMTADCELTGTEPVRGPSVPASFVRVRENETYLAFDGVYRKVEGFLLDGFFVLNDRDLEGKTVDWVGEFPERLTGGDDAGGDADAAGAPHGDGAAARFSVTGELVPSDTTDVVVGRIYRQQKVAWLIPEDSSVKEGDVVARLDPADTDEEIKEQQIQVERARSAKESEEEALKRRTRANEFRLEQARKLLVIAELKLDDLRTPDVTAQLLSARLKVEQARVRLEFLDRELARIDAMTVQAVSPLEVERMRRDRQRAALQLEAAELQLKVIEDGPDEVELCRAELNVLEARMNADTLAKKLQTDEARYNYGLRRATRWERWRSERVKSLQEQRENLTVKAPRAGLVRYSKVWNGGVWSKVHVGSMARHRSVLMTVANISRMYVRLEVPERYFTKVSAGMEVDVKASSLTDATLKGTVMKTEFLFQPKRKKDTERGLYSSHEELGETVFFTHVEIDEQQGVTLKPGAVAEVFFPFGRVSSPSAPVEPVSEPLASADTGEDDVK
jgi:multidrug resistance efflux pump